MNQTAQLKLSEIFDSVQGEGPSAGLSCTFLRLALCNLRCSWCDTKYTWDFARYDYAKEVKTLGVAEVAEDIRQRSPKRLVITGGEPLLQQAPLVTLLASLDFDLAVEVETNGTLTPKPALLERIQQWNVSPKLANSGEALNRRLQVDSLTTFLRTGRAWLKFVVESEQDIEQIEALSASLQWPRERVLLMPQAATRQELLARLPLVARLAAERQFSLSPRLHVEHWDGERGR